MRNKLVRHSFLLVTLIITVSCSTTAAANRWEAFSFNGKSFYESPGDYNSIWIREFYVPRTSPPRDDSSDSKRLSQLSGAVSGICYRQTYGGKLAKHDTVIPLPNEEITIQSVDNTTYKTKTDLSGIFIKTLPQGDYRILCRGVGVNISIKEGKTELVAIRGAKRMTD